MTTSVDTKAQDGGAADTVKLAVAIPLVIAGVAGYYVLGNQPAWLRWLAVAAGIVLAAVVMAFSKYGTAVKQIHGRFARGAAQDRVADRQETGMTTLVVFVFLLRRQVFLLGLDLALAWATRALTGQGG